MSSIVSLLPSATEIVCGLGLGERLVGISHECDYPEQVGGLPVVSRAKIDAGASSRDIDQSVRSIVQRGLSVYDIDVPVLRRLKPDLIVTQDQCEVCAVSLGDVQDACRQLGLPGTRICSLNPNDLADVRRDFHNVAESAGVPERGVRLVTELDAAFEEIRARAAGRPSPTVVCVEWLDPPMIAGGWMPELVRIAGGRPLIVTEPERFETVTWADVVAADPDCVVVMPCGFDIPRTLAELRTGAAAEALRGMRATRTGKTFVVDGNAHFNRPGPRLAESADILERIFTGDGPEKGASCWGGSV